MIRRAIALLGAVAILGLTVACNADASEAPEGAFYLEAEIAVSVDRPGGELIGSLRGPMMTGLRWWYRDPDHFRHEYYHPSDMLEWGPRWTAADGDDLVFYDPITARYQRWDLEESGFSGMYPGFSAVLGPIPGGTIDVFLDDWRSRVERIEHVGTEELLGRTVQVYEYGPTSSSSTGSSSGAVVDTTSGVGRFYIDEEAGFILRNSVDGGMESQSFNAELTLLDLEPEFEDGRFDIDLPDGAVEDESSESCTSEMRRIGPPFVNIPVPAGWSYGGSGGRSSPGCVWSEQVASYSKEPAGILLITQQPVPPTGVPDARRDATPVAIGNLEGYRLTVEGYERLVWVQGEVIVTIESNAAPFEELLRIAESAE
ncbi:MAG: hypothetical protein M0R75_11645 [Dehalococcoidia bacterium]|nr:hypothetical protein [Dehalococcoidia bacterium]